MSWMLIVALCACGDSVVSEGNEAQAKCGAVSCGVNEYCCDAACGLCIAEGVACTTSCGD